MSEIEIKQLQEKINAGILLARKRLIEKTKKENGELVVVRDGKVVCIKAQELEELSRPQEFGPRLPQSRGFFIDGSSSQEIAGRTDFQPETVPPFSGPMNRANCNLQRRFAMAPLRRLRHADRIARNHPAPR